MIMKEFDVSNISVADYIDALEKHVITNLRMVYTFGSVTIEASDRVYVRSGRAIKSVEEELNSLPEKERNSYINILKKYWEVKKEKAIKEFNDIKGRCDYVYEGNKSYKALVSQFDILTTCQATQTMKDFHEKCLKGRSVKSYAIKAKNMSYTNNVTKTSC